MPRAAYAGGAVAIMAATLVTGSWVPRVGRAIIVALTIVNARSRCSLSRARQAGDERAGL
jgi:hypothetical protein